MIIELLVDRSELLHKKNKKNFKKAKKFLTKANDFDRISELLIERTASKKKFKK